MAGRALVLDVGGELVARGNATGPARAFGIETKLVHRRRIDAAKTDFGVADLDLVAVMDLRNASDVGGLGDRRQQQQRNGEQQSHEHARSPYAMQNRKRHGTGLWCGFDRPTSARSRAAVNLTRRQAEDGLLASPRLRGEAGVRSTPGEGDSPRVLNMP